MASSNSPGRILRIDEPDTSTRADECRYCDEDTEQFDTKAPTETIVASKPCVAPGCRGTMNFHPRLTVEAFDAPHTLEWPWYATWRCARDSTHFQIISHAEEREIRIRTAKSPRS